MLFRHTYLYVVTILILSLTSCKLDEPVIPEGELYTRHFIKAFGLIDPDQDWNIAERSYVFVQLGDAEAVKVDVICELSNQYYLLASHTNVSGDAKIPFDMPEGLDTLILRVDGKCYKFQPGSKVKVNTSSSRAGEDDDDDTDDTDDTVEINIDDTDLESIKWLIVAEDLGSTDDFDFNDFIAQITVPTPILLDIHGNGAEWNDKPGEIIPLQAPSRVGEETTGHDITIKAMAAGGTLKLWLHYRSAKGLDYIIGPGNDKGYILTDKLLTSGNADIFEWHQWFYNDHTYHDSKTMINTGGVSISREGMTISLPVKENDNDDRVVDSDFTIKDYSILTPQAQSDEGLFKYTIQKGFYITVNKYSYDDNLDGYVQLGQVIGGPIKGNAPQMFLIPDTGNSEINENGRWSWPCERKNIKYVYPSFSDWASSATGSAQWYTDKPNGYRGNDYYLR